MPIEYDIIDDKRLVLAKGSGVISSVDIIEHLYRLAADSRYTAPMKKLVDYRFIEDIQISPEEAQEIAQKKRSYSNTVVRDVLLYHRRMEPMALHECIRHLVRAVTATRKFLGKLRML